MKMRTIVMMFVYVGFISCDDNGDYLKYHVELEKAGDCNSINPVISVEANTIGERYVFEHCLAGSQDPEYYMERGHDTIFLRFGKSNDPKSRYKVTLDVNTRPEYHYLSIDGNVTAINIKR